MSVFKMTDQERAKKPAMDPKDPYFAVSDASIEAIMEVEDRLNAFNCEKINAFDAQDLSIILRDPCGHLYAGLHGFTWGGYGEIKLLWVDQARRAEGVGSKLMASAEDAMRERGCDVVILTTHSFQAPGFYEGRGYQRIVEVADCPKGHSHIALMKRL